MSLDQDQLQKDALTRHLHSMGGKGDQEVSITFAKDEDGDYVAVGEFHRLVKAVVLAHATVVDGAVVVDEVWLEGAVLEECGHAILRALGR